MNELIGDSNSNDSIEILRAKNFDDIIEKFELIDTDNDITQYESSLIDNVEALVKQIIGKIKNPKNELEYIYAKIFKKLIESLLLLENLNEIHILYNNHKDYKYISCMSRRTSHRVKKDKKSIKLKDCSLQKILEAIVKKLDWCGINIFDNNKKLIEPHNYIPENVTYYENGYDDTSENLIEFATGLKKSILYFSEKFLLKFKNKYENLKKEHVLEIKKYVNQQNKMTTIVTNTVINKNEQADDDAIIDIGGTVKTYSEIKFDSENYWFKNIKKKDSEKFKIKKY